MLFQEKPIYTLPQVRKRVIIPKVLLLLLLGIIFYVGILLNISLLDLRGQQETVIQSVALGIVVLIIVVGIIMAIIKSKNPYIFYSTYLQFGKKKLTYVSILTTEPKKNIVDKIFKTYSIPLTKKFKIQNIAEQIQIQGYLQQLMQYAQNQVNSTASPYTSGQQQP